jgi:hypothetical protein
MPDDHELPKNLLSKLSIYANHKCKLWVAVGYTQMLH